MSRGAEKLAQFIRDNYSSEGWEVTGESSTQNKVWVMCPVEVDNLTDALQELLGEFGAVCDLLLTDDGATLTFVVPASWDHPAEVTEPAATVTATKRALGFSYYGVGVIAAVLVVLLGWIVAPPLGNHTA